MMAMSLRRPGVDCRARITTTGRRLNTGMHATSAIRPLLIEQGLMSAPASATSGSGIGRATLSGHFQDFDWPRVCSGLGICVHPESAIENRRSTTATSLSKSSATDDGARPGLTTHESWCRPIYRSVPAWASSGSKCWRTVTMRRSGRPEEVSERVMERPTSRRHAHSMEARILCVLLVWWPRPVAPRPHPAPIRQGNSRRLCTACRVQVDPASPAI